MADSSFKGWEFPAAKADPPRERFLKLISCPETTGYDKATVLFSHIPPQSSTGIHTHDSDEIMYFVGRGEGTVGGEKVRLETDSVLVVPRGVEHECRNTSGTETLKIFCVYIPPLKLSPMLTELAERTKKHLKK